MTMHTPRDLLRGRLELRQHHVPPRDSDDDDDEEADDDPERKNDRESVIRDPANTNKREVGARR
jgi:hypothetical protein